MERDEMPCDALFVGGRACQPRRRHSPHEPDRGPQRGRRAGTKEGEAIRRAHHRCPREGLRGRPAPAVWRGHGSPGPRRAHSGLARARRRTRGALRRAARSSPSSPRRGLGSSALGATRARQRRQAHHQRSASCANGSAESPRRRASTSSPASPATTCCGRAMRASASAPATGASARTGNPRISSSPDGPPEPGDHPGRGASGAPHPQADPAPQPRRRLPADDLLHRGQGNPRAARRDP